MDNVIFRGTLTKEKLKELCGIQKDQIILEKQQDGNWKGRMLKDGNFIEVREQAPEYCLQRLLTHD